MVAELAGKQDLLSRLNDEQKKAVCLSWGPALVVAGAGSGKTTVLTRRIAYLISELRQDPSEILAVTFTNKAAAEMKARVEKIVGPEYARRSWIGTFHSICARILRKEIENYESAEGLKWSRNFVIYDETDSKNVLKGIIKAMNLDEKVFAPKDMKHSISALKNDGFTAHLYSGESRSYRENRISEIFTAYQKELSRNNALDFDDLILVFTELLKQNLTVRKQIQAQFRHVLIDEFQDTNKAQYDMVRLMTDPTDSLRMAPEGEFRPDPWNERTLMVVGDVDQSIYSWRKADYRIFLGFQHDYEGAELIKLEENYRSSETILDIANSIITNNLERIEKELRCNRGKGSKAQYYEASDEIDEAFYVVEELKRMKAGGRKNADSVILYRTNAQTRAIEEVMIRSAIPYALIGGTKFYDRQEIKDVIAYLKLVYNPDDGQAFARIINSPKRGIGKSSIERLQEFAASRSISNVQAAALAEQVPNLPPKAKAALKEFAYCVLNRWRPEKFKPKSEDDKSQEVSELLRVILSDIKYIDMLEEEANSSKDEIAYGRIENVKEFMAVAKEFEEIADEPNVESFLTRISLVSDLDQMKADEDTVKLMTLHAAKGLEFPVVFLMGLEDGLFPHMRSLDSPTALEEERRLMYVGITRAEDKLYITRARKRTTLGRNASNSSGFSTSSTIPSRFLQEIKPGLLVGYFPDQSRGRGYEDDRNSRYEDDSRFSDEDEYSDSRGSGSRFGGGGSYESGSKYQGGGYGGGSRYGGNDDSGYIRDSGSSSSRSGSGASGAGSASGASRGGYQGSGSGGRSNSGQYGGGAGQQGASNGGRPNSGYGGGGAGQQGASNGGRPNSGYGGGGAGQQSAGSGGRPNSGQYGGGAGQQGAGSGGRPNSGQYGGGGGYQGAGGGGRPNSGYGGGGGHQGAGGGGRPNSGYGAGGGGAYKPATGIPQNAAKPKPRAMRITPETENQRRSGRTESAHERLQVGDRVQHSKFGAGEVVQVIGEGNKELYNVQFETSKRLLDPTFAKLIKLN